MNLECIAMLFFFGFVCLGGVGKERVYALGKKVAQRYLVVFTLFKFATKAASFAKTQKVLKYVGKDLDWHIKSLFFLMFLNQSLFDLTNQNIKY